MSVSVTVGGKTKKKRERKSSSTTEGGGYRIVCSIARIEQSNEVPKNHIVLETTETIPEINADTNMEMDSSGMSLVLPGTEDVVVIKPQKHVKVMARNVGGGTNTANIGVFTMSL